MSHVDPGAGVSANGGSPSPSGSGSPAASPAAPGSAAPSPGARPVISWETAPAQLRTEYENQKLEAARHKAEAERWQKLGDYDSVSKVHETFTGKLLAEALTMGKALGYTDEQVRESMLKNPRGTLDWLQQKHADPNVQAQQAEEQRLQALIDKRVQPINDRYDATMNRDAESLYEGERARLFKEDFAKGLPDENRDELFELLDARVAGDPQALQDLKFGKQTAAIAKHWKDAKDIFLKRHNAYSSHERGAGGTPPKNGNGNGKDGKPEPKTSFGLTAREMFRSL